MGGQSSIVPFYTTEIAAASPDFDRLDHLEALQTAGLPDRLDGSADPDRLQILGEAGISALVTKITPYQVARNGNVALYKAHGQMPMEWRGSTVGNQSPFGGRRTPETSRLRQRLTAIAAVVSFAAASASLAGATPAAAAAPAEAPPIPAGGTVTVDVVPDKIMVGTMTSVNTTNNGAWGAVFGEAGYQGTSTTNIAPGPGMVSPNAFFVDTGVSGQITIRNSPSAAQQQILDRGLYIPKGPNFQFLPSPVRSLDTRTTHERYKGGAPVKISYGIQHGRQAVFVNVTVDDGSSYYAAYPCADGYQGTSTVNATPGNPLPQADVVMLDANGDLCLQGPNGAAGLIEDTYGFATIPVESPVRILDTRLTGNRLAAGGEMVIHTGVPNAVFIGRLTADNVGKGFLAAWPTLGGNPGNSNVNPDGNGPASGLLVIPTDPNGDITIFASKGTGGSHVILDKTAVIPMAALGIDPATVTPPRRLLDSRSGMNISDRANTPPPVITPNPNECDRVAFIDNGVVTVEKLDGTSLTIGAGSNYPGDAKLSALDCRTVYFSQVQPNGTLKVYSQDITTHNTPTQLPLTGRMGIQTADGRVSSLNFNTVQRNEQGTTQDTAFVDSSDSGYSAVAFSMTLDGSHSVLLQRSNTAASSSQVKFTLLGANRIETRYTVDADAVSVTVSRDASKIYTTNLAGVVSTIDVATGQRTSVQSPVAAASRLWYVNGTLLMSAVPSGGGRTDTDIFKVDPNSGAITLFQGGPGNQDL